MKKDSTATVYSGSSPPTRGALPLRVLRRLLRRIIPAYAGSTSSRSIAMHLNPDHPRLRGEHTGWCGWDSLSDGSSPPTRGAHPSVEIPIWQRRIIPAYAGSTRGTRALKGERPDHPRLRGEHHTGRDVDPRRHGSSPPTRGAHINGKCNPPNNRIIPAYAGSTAVKTLREAARAGSSPPTRGAPTHPWWPNQCGRIIPAYAGSTTAIVQDCPYPADHPRLRGEHLSKLVSMKAPSGSSPPTRGALTARAAQVARDRIIPAYAGSTGDSDVLVWADSDHPRLRGEHEEEMFLTREEAGSSPPTRGARIRDVPVHLLDRIIPAYAGSTREYFLHRNRSADHPRLRGEHLISVLVL